jgi:hypothetical protein
MSHRVCAESIDLARSLVRLNKHVLAQQGPAASVVSAGMALLIVDIMWHKPVTYAFRCDKSADEEPVLRSGVRCGLQLEGMLVKVCQ